MRSRRIAAALACALLATACAQVPRSGQVKVGPLLPALFGLNNDTIHELPPGPQPGVTPAALVEGFLHAMVDSEENYVVARLFLATGASWATSEGITTYDASSMRVSRVGETVVVRVHRVGQITPRGSYTVTPGTIVRRFAMVRNAGQWRISRLTGGVLLSTDDAQRALQSANVYYLNSAEDRLVPDPLLVPPQQPGLATTLIEDLLSGPSPSLAAAVRTAVPPGAGLVGNVPITASGVAEVDFNFTNGARQISGAALERLSAQVVWTLRQLTSVTAVQLLVNGTALSAPDVASLQAVRAWPQFDPAAPPSTSGALLVRSGEAAGLGTSVPAALVRRRLSSPAQSADGAVVAGLRIQPGGVSLMVGPATGPLVARASAGSISAPTFDPQDDVFAAQSGPGGDRVVEYPARGAARVLDLPVQLAVEPIQAIALSRDGSRIAVVVGPTGDTALMVGTIASPPSHPAIRDVHLVVPAGRDVQGVAWAGAGELVTTVHESAGRRGVIEASVDGYHVAALTGVGLPASPDQVAAAPGRRILAATDGAIWALAGRQWVRAATGTDPSYAG